MDFVKKGFCPHPYLFTRFSKPQRSFALYSSLFCVCVVCIMWMTFYFFSLSPFSYFFLSSVTNKDFHCVRIDSMWTLLRFLCCNVCCCGVLSYIPLFFLSHTHTFFNLHLFQSQFMLIRFSPLEFVPFCIFSQHIRSHKHETHTLAGVGIQIDSTTPRSFASSHPSISSYALPYCLLST